MLLVPTACPGSRVRARQVDEWNDLDSVASISVAREHRRFNEETLLQVTSPIAADGGPTAKHFDVLDHVDYMSHPIVCRVGAIATADAFSLEMARRQTQRHLAIEIVIFPHARTLSLPSARLSGGQLTLLVGGGCCAHAGRGSFSGPVKTN